MIPDKEKNNKTYTEQLEKRTQKKQQNEKYKQLLTQVKKVKLSYNTLELINNCGTFLEFLATKDLEHTKLNNANFCKHRFCPHCSYNKARKDCMELITITKYLKEKGFKFLFLTLTAPNVKGENLKNEINDYSNSFQRFIKLKTISKVVKGYVRKLEVTYNPTRKDYHPHYHVLIAVNPSYFTDKDYYISRNEWLELWKKSKRNEDITQVDVRKFDIDKNPTAIFEMSKYIAKDSNYMDSVEVFETFYKALKGTREFSYNGAFKEARKLYKLKELDYLKEKDDYKYFYKIWNSWKSGKYQVDKIQELSSEELKKIEDKGYFD